MSKIKTTCIKNPFQPRLPENKDEREFDFKDQTINEIFCSYFPIPNNDTSIVASINGEIIKNDSWDVHLKAGDHLVFVPVPKGGGGGGSNPLMIVAMVAVAALAMYTGGAAFSAMYGAYSAAGAGVSTAAWGAMQVAGGLVSAAIMVGGGMLVSSIFPTAKIGIEKGDLSESSPTYGWSTFNNSSQEGTTLPIIIGERRVAPPVIAAHSETIDGQSYLSMLYAVSEGEIENIYGVEINDQPVSYYSNVEIYTRLGKDNQTIIPHFSDVYSDSSIGSTLKRNEYTIRETSGTGLDAVQVHISLPMGLWYANNKGSLDEQTITLALKYRRVGATNWSAYSAQPEEIGAEVYHSSRVYTPGEAVLFNGNYYKCTKYYIRSTVSDKETGETTVENKYVDSLKKYTFINRRTEALPTPAPPSSECWEIINQDLANLSITSNSNSAINKTYRIGFPVRGQYEIACTVINGPPEDNARYGSKAIWTGITEIINDDLVYPGTALLGIRIIATDQLSGGLPRVTCVAKKTSHTFPLAGSVSLTNPAWASYYALNNKIWGGSIPESKIKLSDFQAWASYCELKGLSANLYIDQRMTYNDLKNYFCELGRANVIQYGVSYGAIVDKPDVPTQLFTIGNVLKDSFKMNYLPIDDRANVIRVHYYDKESNWEKSTIEVRTEEFITGNKEKAQEITLYACDNSEIAKRHAILLLNYNKNLLRTCSFSTSIDSIACTIGDIILVQQDTTHYGYGGRLVSVTGNTITIDRKIDLKSGATYGVIIRDGSNDDLLKRTFTVASDGEYSSFILNQTLPATVKINDVYSIGEITIEAKPFRVISITREETFTRKIVALEYYDEVYNDSEIIYDVKEYSYMIPPIVSGLNVVEIIDNIFDKFTKVRLSWKCNSSYGVNVSYTFDSGTTKNVFVGNFKENFVEIDGLPIGTPIAFKVEPANNAEGQETVTVTLWAEENVIYDSGCYEYDVFANKHLQDSVGAIEPFTMWMQEPQRVEVEFLT